MMIYYLYIVQFHTDNILPECIDKSLNIPMVVFSYVSATAPDFMLSGKHLNRTDYLMRLKSVG